MVTPTWTPLEELETAVREILSPHDSVPLVPWCEAVRQRILTLTGADGAMLHYPEVGPAVVAPADGGGDGDRGSSRASGVREGFPPARAMVAREVDPAGEEAAMHDAVSMFVRLAGGIEAWLTVYTSRPRGREYRERTMDRLRGVLPAFRFAASMRWEFGVWTAAFARVLDATGHGALLCSETGRVLHANRALLDMLASNPDSSRVRGAMEQLARRLARKQAGEDSTEPMDRQIATPAGKVRLRARWIDGSAFDGAATILVFAEPHPRHSSTSDLRERFGLTIREVEVAEMMSRGWSNREIAAILGISPFTVQNHVRKVLEKLGVKSRAAVAATLLD